MVNRIHDSALVDPDVEMGDGNVIGAYAVLQAPLRLGDDNWIGPHVVLGSPGEIRGGPHLPHGGGGPQAEAAWRCATADPDDSRSLLIGSGNVLREFTTVQAGHSPTRIADRCYLMTRSYLAHDVQLDDDVTLATSVMLAGHVRVGRGATVGMGAVIHQRLAIGAGAMVGMSAVVTRSVPPWAVAFGAPAKVQGANVHRLRGTSVTGEQAASLDGDYRDGRAPSPPPSLDEDFTRFAQWHGGAVR